MCLGENNVIMNQFGGFSEQMFNDLKRGMTLVYFNIFKIII